MDKELIVVKGKVIEQQRSYTPEMGKEIGYEVGSKMIKRHYDENPDDMVAHFIGRNHIGRILAQPGCVGIRAFYALNELGISQLVLVGVNSQGNNLLMLDYIDKQGELAKKPGSIVITSKGCPPHCDGSSDGTVDDSSSWT
jgi:hypothetical protein